MLLPDRLHDVLDPHSTLQARAAPRYVHHPILLLAAGTLRGASRMLDAMAGALAPEPDPNSFAPDAVVEFHGEAGAPEGALYVDGRLIGHVLGVNRL